MKLYKNISWVLGANLFVSLTKWLTIIIIARFLTPEDVGIYSLAFAIGAPLTLFANMKLRSLYITDQKNGFYDFLHSRNILSVITFIALLLIAQYVYPQYFLVIILVGLAKIFDLQSEMWYSLPHKKQDMTLIGKIMIYKHILLFSTFTLLLYLSRDLIIALFIQLIVQFLYLIFIENFIIKKKYLFETKGFNFKKIKTVIKIGLPLGFVQLIVSFNTSYPRYLLEEFQSAEILGYFSAIAHVLVIGNVLMSALSQNFLPLLADKVEKKNYKSFKKIVFYDLSILSTLIGICGILFSVLFGELFLQFVYGAEYATYNNLLILMSIVLAINCFNWNFDTAFLALRYLKVQPKIAITMLFFNTIVGYLLIVQYGLEGAAYTLIATSLIQISIKIIYLYKKTSRLI